MPRASTHLGVGVGLTLVRRWSPSFTADWAWIQERDLGGGASFQVFLPGAPPIEATA